MITIQDLLQRMWESIRPSRRAAAEASVPVLLALGLIYMMVLAFRQDWVALVLFVPGWALLLGLGVYPPLRQRLLTDGEFNLRHALHLLLYSVLSGVWLALLRLMIATPAVGKESEFFYVALLAFGGVTWAGVRSLLVVTYPRAYALFSTDIPLWEQLLLVFNEGVALGLAASVWAGVLVRVFQPFVFTVRLNLTYGLGLGGAALLYYALLQMMWWRRWNRWLSRDRVWLVLARLSSPFFLFAVSVLIARRFTVQTDPRTASLLDNSDVDLAVLSLAPVMWLLTLVLIVLVFTSGRGIKQQFLPDALLEHLPGRMRRLFEAISDTDLLLVIGVVVTTIPVYLLLLGESGGAVDSARQVILQRGSALIETSEQALALLFVLPFYVFVVGLLLLYAAVVSRPALSAEQRESLMDRLPVGFLITLILTLYLFAVPFTQVFSEGRLPTPSRDLGRILAFYVLLPLLLLYVHYFILVRLPYGRGQHRWRVREAVELEQDLKRIDRRINNLNQELNRMDTRWNLARGDDAAAVHNRMDTLHRYIHLNGERDNLNMQRLQILAARQNLTEISETPVSVAVARLPLRIISLGIPLLLLFQLYQWAVLNEGLREVVNNPNITVADFIKILLDNIEF